MRAAQIKIRVQRGKPEKVRAADRREDEWLGLAGNDSFQSWINLHARSINSQPITINFFSRCAATMR